MARDRNEYVTIDISEKPFNECCDEKVSSINSKFDTIVEKVNERRQQLIKSVEVLKRQYSSWKEYIDKLKRDCNKMQAEAERKNCEPLLRDLTEKHISEIKTRFSSIEKQEKYYKKKEILLHLDTDSVLMHIQGLGRIRVKGTLDQFQELSIQHKPLCVKYDRNSNSYYVLTSRNIQVLDDSLNPTNNFSLILPTNVQYKQIEVGGIAIGPYSIYISVPSHCLIQEYQGSGELIGTIGVQGEGVGELMTPEGLEVHPSSERLYVCEYHNNRLQVFDHRKHHMFIGDKPGQLKSPKSIAITALGNLIVFHKSHPCIHVYTDDGNLICQYGSMCHSGELRGLNWIETSPKGVEIGTTVNGRVSLMVYPRDMVVELTASQRAGCGDKLGGVAVGKRGNIVLCDTEKKRLICFKMSDYLPVFPEKQ